MYNEHYYNKSQWPVLSRRSRHTSRDRGERDDESISNESEDENSKSSFNSFESIAPRNNKNNPQSGLIYFVISILICIFGGYAYSNFIEHVDSCKPVPSENYSFEDPNIWYALNSGMEEVVNLNKPSVFVFLYRRTEESKLDSFLTELSEYINCLLNTEGAIVVRGKDLNVKENLRSYGNVIDMYKAELEKTGVMIVQKVNLVDSYVAQAFHSFCDEYTPLVAKSVVIFTIEVENFNGKSVAVADKVLRNSWKSLESDILEPLLTRVTGMVLKFYLKN